MKLPSIHAFDKYLSREKWRAEHGETGFTGYQVRGKPKIHGVSMSLSIRVTAGGVVTPTSQLRKSGDPSSDVVPGYAAVRDEIEAGLWAGRVPAWGETGILAEWAGPGIQKRDAVTKIDRPRLFVFAAWFFNGGSVLERADRYRSGESGIEARNIWRSANLITCPQTLARIINPSEHVEILPWITDDLRTEGLGQIRAGLVAHMANRYVADCALKDSYIADRFGIEAPGEGMVAMPVSQAFMEANFETFAELSWKAKTPVHSVKRVSRPATTKVELPAGIDGLVSDFVTPARVDQIISETFSGKDLERSGTGAFVAAMVADVLKESKEERASLDAPEAAIGSALRTAARQAYLSLCDQAG